MSMRGPRGLIPTLILTLTLSLGYHYLWVFDPLIGPVYDWVSDQKPIPKDRIRDNLATFESASFQRWETTLQARWELSKKDSVVYAHKLIRRVDGFDRYRYVAGRYRARDFMTPQRILAGRVPIPHPAKTQFLVLDPPVLERLMEIEEHLESEGLDAEALTVTSGFRNPAYNRLIKGAAKSRHQHGDAIDISVGDVNRDGRSDLQDTEHVYALALKVIGNGGGVGRYRNHEQLVHIDTRGRRARWSD